MEFDLQRFAPEIGTSDDPRSITDDNKIYAGITPNYSVYGINNSIKIPGLFRDFYVGERYFRSKWGGGTYILTRRLYTDIYYNSQEYNYDRIQIYDCTDENGDEIGASVDLFTGFDDFEYLFKDGMMRAQISRLFNDASGGYRDRFIEYLKVSDYDFENAVSPDILDTLDSDAYPNFLRSALYYNGSDFIHMELTLESDNFVYYTGFFDLYPILITFNKTITDGNWIGCDWSFNEDEVIMELNLDTPGLVLFFYGLA